MIERLELENFRSHKKTEFKFSEGTNILIGISGSGKSSVLDGICFALYGNTPKLQARKLKVSDLIMDKPIREEEATIKLFFEADGKNYEVIRTIYREKSTYAELREDGTLKATSTTLVTEMIERILKASFDLFSKIIYSEQNQMDYFLTVPKGDRMNKIDELLKLQKFEKARHIAVSFANKLKFKAKNLQEAVEKFNEEQLRKDKDQIERELKELEKQTMELSKKTLGLSGLLKTLHITLDQKEKSRQEIEKLKGMRKESEGVVKLLDSELKTLPDGDINIAKSNYEIKRIEYDGRLKLEEARRKEVATLESELREKRRGIEEKNKALEFLKSFDSKKAEGVESQLRLVKDDLLRVRLLSKELLSSIESLESKSSLQKCPTCDADLTAEKRTVLVKEKKDQAKKLEAEISSLSEKIENFQKESDREKKNREYANFYKRRIEQLGEIEKEIFTREKRLKELEETKTDVQGVKEEFEIVRLIKENLERRISKAEKLKDYRKTLLEVEKKLSEIQFDGLEYEKIKGEIEAKERIKISLDKDLQYSLQLQMAKGKTLDGIIETLNFIDKNRSDIEYLKYSTGTLDNFSDVLSDVQGKLREEFVLTLNDVMNEIWSELYPYEDYSAIRFKIEDNDYTLQLCDLKNNWVNVEGISSGGERAIASFVMRVALSVILAPNLRMLILDEPTHNLDATTIENLTEILRTKLTDLIDQIFIVTHDERLVQAGTAYIYELRREGKKKEPTVVHRVEGFLGGS